MLRAWMLALVLLLGAGEAHAVAATLRWVAPQNRGIHPGSSSAAGTDSTIPMDLYTANRREVLNVTYVCLGGDYSKDMTHSAQYVGGRWANNNPDEQGTAINPFNFEDTVPPPAADQRIRFVAKWSYAGEADDRSHYIVSSIRFEAMYLTAIGFSTPYGGELMMRSSTAKYGVRNSNIQNWPETHAGSGGSTGLGGTIVCDAGSSHYATSPWECGPNGYSWYGAAYDSIAYCTATTWSVQGVHDCVFDHCNALKYYQSAAASAYGAGVSIQDTGDDANNLPHCERVEIANCVIQLDSLGVQMHAFNFRDIDGFTMHHTQIQMSLFYNSAAHVDTDDPKAYGIYMGHCKNMKFYNNRWDVRLLNCKHDVTTSADSMLFNFTYFRDSTTFVSFDSDSFFLGQRGTGGVSSILVGSGNWPGGPFTSTYTGAVSPSGWNDIQHVSWTNCMFIGRYEWTIKLLLKDWIFSGCLFVNDKYNAFKADEGSTDVASTVEFRRCSFISNGPNPAFVYKTGPTGSLRVTNSIFYRTATANTTDGVIVKITGGSTAPSLFMDNNLYWSPTDSAKAAISWEGQARQGCAPQCSSCSSYGAGIYNPPCFASTGNSGREQNSRWGDPVYSGVAADSTFNGLPSCVSAACFDPTHQCSNNFSGGGGHPVDAADSTKGAVQNRNTIPASVNLYWASYDLAGHAPPTAASNALAVRDSAALDTVSVAPTTQNWRFRAAANDSSTYLGTPSGYLVAYGTTAVTEGNFWSQSILVLSGSAPGTDVAFQIGSLSNATIYYVGIKTYNSCGNLSPLSFVQCAPTRTSSGAGAGAICRGN